MPTYDPNQSAATYDTPFGHEREESPLMRHYTFKTAKSVLITGGVAEIVMWPTPADIAAADDGSGEGGKAFFRGGTQAIEVTAGEAAALTAAGLTVT